MSLIDEVRERLAMPGPAEARRIRMQAGVSQERLAEELQVHPVSVWRWEAGERHPRGELRRKYGKLLAELGELTGRGE